MKPTGGLLKTITSTFTMALVAFVFIVEALLLPQAHASSSAGSRPSSNVRCEALFIPSDLRKGQRLYDFESRELPADATLASSLPIDFQNLLEGLKPKITKRFEKRFTKRGKVLAEEEASRLVQAFLFDAAKTDPKLLSGFDLKKRRDALTGVLDARLDIKDAEVHLEKLLLEIGYGEGTPLANKWSDFRAKNFRRLTFFLRQAVNAATTYAFAVPLSYLKPYEKYQYFRPTRAQRHYWNLIEPTLRKKIEERHPGPLRELRTELAMKFLTRMAAAIVIAVLADELLEFSVPQWHVYKMSHGGGMLADGRAAIVETRTELEQMAYDKWKNIMTDTGFDVPADNSPEAQDIRSRIQATPKAELWMHVHEHGPLSDPSKPPPQFSPDPRLYPREEIQMSPAPMTGP